MSEATIVISPRLLPQYLGTVAGLARLVDLLQERIGEAGIVAAQATPDATLWPADDDANWREAWGQAVEQFVREQPDMFEPYRKAFASLAARVRISQHGHVGVTILRPGKRETVVDQKTNTTQSRETRPAYWLAFEAARVQELAALSLDDLFAEKVPARGRGWTERAALLEAGWIEE